jgi:hypothetical protein
MEATDVITTNDHEVLGIGGVAGILRLVVLTEK